MSTLAALLGLVGICFLIALAFALIFLPIKYDLDVYGDYGEHPLSFGLAFIQVIGIIAVYGSYDEKNFVEFAVALLFFIAVSVIASYTVYRRLKSWGVNLSRCRIGVIMQLMIPISIIAILLLLAMAKSKADEKKKNN